MHFEKVDIRFLESPILPKRLYELRTSHYDKRYCTGAELCRIPRTSSVATALKFGRFDIAPRAQQQICANLENIYPSNLRWPHANVQMVALGSACRRRSWPIAALRQRTTAAWQYPIQ